MNEKLDGSVVWITSLIIIGCGILIGLVVYGGLNNSACAHPQEDCFKRPKKVSGNRLNKNDAPVKPTSPSHLKGFQKHQDLPITGKWDSETLKSCKNICLNLGKMEEE